MKRKIKSKNKRIVTCKTRDHTRKQAFRAAAAKQRDRSPLPKDAPDPHGLAVPPLLERAEGHLPLILEPGRLCLEPRGGRGEAHVDRKHGAAAARLRRGTQVAHSGGERRLGFGLLFNAARIKSAIG